MSEAIRLPSGSRLSRGTLGLYTSPVHRFGRLWRRIAVNPRTLSASVDLIPPILVSLPGSEPSFSDRWAPTSWQVLDARWTITDVAVIAVGPAGGQPVTFVKIPETVDGLLNLRHQARLLAALHSDRRLGELRALIPRPIAEGEIRGRGWVAECALPGSELQSFRRDSPEYARGLQDAMSFMRRLHSSTATRLNVDEGVFERWIGGPLALLHRLTSTLPKPRQYDAVIDRIRIDLREALFGRTVRVSWIHGDFWPSNVLIAADGTLTGVVDWERAAPDELPIHDLLHLVLHGARFEEAYRDLGATVRAILAGEQLLPDEWQVLRTFDLPVGATSASLRLMVLLYWLRYVATYLDKVPAQARNQWWVRKNVGEVLKAATAG
jgi:hypothetical protein